MNKYLSGLNKLEFVVTNACTGRCKHCSNGEQVDCGCSIDPDVASEAVRAVAREYSIKTVMAFGGEPLLFADTVCDIMRAATEMNVPRRQVITNGYFTRDVNAVSSVAEALRLSGVNDLLLSVDVFHQETIPLDAVRNFAIEVKKCGIPIRLQPAWLVGREDLNPYNVATREILRSLEDTEIPVGEGNVIFPEGNAKMYLSEYFTDGVYENPYEEDPKNVKCLSFSADGSVLDGNIYSKSILEIIEGYAP